MIYPPRRVPMLTRSAFRVIPAILLGLVVSIVRPAFPAADDAPVSAEALPPPASRPVDYERDVAPILSASCYRCHGPKKQQGGLALHAQDRAMAGGDSGPAILPGKGAESRLVRYVAGRLVGATAIEVRVLESSPWAEAFYRRCGFAEHRCLHSRCCDQLQR